MSLFADMAPGIASTSCTCPCHSDGDICVSCARVWCEACRYIWAVENK